MSAILFQWTEVLVNSPAADVPLPDLVITCNNICNTLLKWYENLAAEQAVQRRRFVLSHVSDSVPVVYGTLCLVLNLKLMVRSII